MTEHNASITLMTWSPTPEDGVVVMTFAGDVDVCAIHHPSETTLEVLAEIAGVAVPEWPESERAEARVLIGEPAPVRVKVEGQRVIELGHATRDVWLELPIDA